MDDVTCDNFVTPAKAGVQYQKITCFSNQLDSRLRGNDIKK